MRALVQRLCLYVLAIVPLHAAVTYAQPASGAYPVKLKRMQGAA